MLETYFTLRLGWWIARELATVICVFNNRRISATVCGAALLAGTLTVPTAQAATVGEPVERQSGDTTCSIELNAAEQAHFETLVSQLSSETETNARIKGFESLNPLIGKTGDGLRAKLSTAEGIADLQRNYDATLSKLADGLAAKTGVDRAAAFWYFTAVVNPFLVDTQRGVLAYTEDAIYAGEIAPLSAGDVDEVPVYNELGIAAELRYTFPGMSNADITRWADAYVATSEIELLKQAATFQESFNNARALCDKSGGIELLPTKDNTTNPDLKTVSTYSALPGTTPLDSGTEKPSDIDGVKKTVTSEASDKNTGIIIGVIVALLAVLGIGVAAFALGR